MNHILPAIPTHRPAAHRRRACLKWGGTLGMGGMLPWLAGCAAPQTQLMMNPRLAEPVKQRSFKSYKEVLLVLATPDPQRLAPRAAAELEGLGYKVTRVEPGRPLEGPQGTGFVISAEGHVLTCAHVLGNERLATLTLNGQRVMADLVQADRVADLAVLRTRTPLPAGTEVLGLRPRDAAARLGEEVYTIGYPLSRLLGNSARMSRGLLSATAGMRDDPKQIQVSAEIHPGNSGGPLLDKDGLVLGVVQQTINPARVQQLTGGALPQNINFAIKHNQVLDFLRVASPAAHAAAQKPAGAMSLERAGKGVAKVQAGTPMADELRREKMVVRLSYQPDAAGSSQVRQLVLAALDFETQEVLFLAGQPNTAPAADGTAVMQAALVQARQALGSR